MRRIYVLIIFAILIFGCTVQKAEIKSAANATKEVLDDTSVQLEEIYENDSVQLENLDQELTSVSYSLIPSVDYFFSPSCFACKNVSAVISLMRNESIGKINWIDHNINTQKGLDEFNQFAIKLNFSNEQRVVPLFVYNNKILKGTWEINETSLRIAIKEVENN